MDEIQSRRQAARERCIPESVIEWWLGLARPQLVFSRIEEPHHATGARTADDHSLHPGPEGNGLLRDAVVASGDAGWWEMMARLERGSWRIRAAAGRWLGGAADVDTVREWIGEKVERARLVASVAAPGGERRLNHPRRHAPTAPGGNPARHHPHYPVGPETWENADPARQLGLRHARKPTGTGRTCTRK
jgi:hypothetical protein